MANTKITTNVIEDGAITSAKLDTNITISGNITGTLATAAQPNITSLGTLTALTGGTGDLNWDSGTLFVDSSANSVGIGTSSPQRPLHVNGTEGVLRLTSTASGNNGFEVGVGTSSQAFLWNAENSHIEIATNNAERMRIDSSGNVGIGRTPTAYGSFKVLDLAGSSGAIQKLIHTGSTVELQSYASSTVGAVGTATSHPLLFTTADTERMRIDSSGKLLIGASSSGTTDLLQIESPATGGGYGIQIRRNDNNTDQQVGQIKFGNVVDSDLGMIAVKTDGANNSGAILFSTASSQTTAERMRIDSSGNVGIGVTSSYPLTVQSGTAGSNHAIALRNNSTNNLARLGFLQQDSATAAYTSIDGDGRSTGYLKFNTNDTERMRITGSGATRIVAGNSLELQNAAGNNEAVIRCDGAGTNTDLRFDTGGSERMRIDTSGKVGIGTSPSTELHVKNSADCTLLLQSGDGNNAEILFGDASDTSRGRIKYLSSDEMTFEVNNLAEKMRISSGGDLLIGMTANDVAQENGAFIQSANGRYFCSLGSNSLNTYHVFSTVNNSYNFYVNCAGTIYSTNTSISSLSDERLKENIVDIDTGLTEVMSLKPRKFDWKDGNGKDIKNDTGFIAQEVETVLPDLIDGFMHNDLDDAKSIKMGDMIPTLVKAIQEQQTIIDDLKTRIEALEG
ncbi:tail fiber domain-containing protein [Gammaproteobacteria bacterium]|nr:tail fiber domain-containing protein [Gammaproteobacteria bacterium]